VANRFLLDANLSPRFAGVLAHRFGLDFRSIVETHPHNVLDTEIMRVAHSEKRIIITRDSDFLNIFMSMRYLQVSVIYLKLSGESRRNPELLERLTRFLELDAPSVQFESVFVTVTEHEFQIDRGWRVFK